MVRTAKYLWLIVVSSLFAILIYSMRSGLPVRLLDNKIVDQLDILWTRLTMPASNESVQGSSILMGQNRAFNVVDYATLIYEDSAKVNVVNKLSLKWHRYKHNIKKISKLSASSYTLPQQMQKVNAYSDKYYKAEGIFWPEFNNDVILSNAGTPVKFEFSKLQISQNYMIALILDLAMSNKYYNELLSSNV